MANFGNINSALLKSKYPFFCSQKGDDVVHFMFHLHHYVFAKQPLPFSFVPFPVDGACAANQFTCLNTASESCIATSLVSNGHADCYDNSDEGDDYLLLVIYLFFCLFIYIFMHLFTGYPLCT